MNLKGKTKEKQSNNQRAKGKTPRKATQKMSPKKAQVPRKKQSKFDYEASAKKRNFIRPHKLLLTLYLYMAYFKLIYHIFYTRLSNGCAFLSGSTVNYCVKYKE